MDLDKRLLLYDCIVWVCGSMCAGEDELVN